MPEMTDVANLIHSTQKMNAISAIPGVGQVIGLGTVALNIGKVFRDTINLLVITLSAASLKQKYKDNDEFWAHKKVEKEHAVANLIHHTKYIGIGLARFALPIIGGLTLWGAKVNPIKDHSFTIVEGKPEVISIWKKFRIEQDKAKLPLKLLAIPVIGQLASIAIILYKTGALVKNIATIAALGLMIKFGTEAKKQPHGDILTHKFRDLKDDLECIGSAILSGALPVVGALVLMSAGIHTPSEELAEMAPPDFFGEDHAAIDDIHAWVAKQPVPPMDDHQSAIRGWDRNHKRIAMILGDSQLSETKWEGGQPADAINFWTLVLNKNKGIGQALTSEEYSAVMEDFKDVKFIGSNMRDEKNEAKPVVDYITQRLKKRGRCVIPLQTRVGKGGHVSAVVFEKRADGKIDMYHMNVGEGSENFPVLKIGHKTQRSYRTQKRTLVPDLLTGANSTADNEIIGLILRISTTDPTLSKAKWDTHLLQNILASVSTPNKEDIIPLTHTVSSQRSGTCTEQLARLIIRDQLIHKNHAKANPELQHIKYKRTVAKERYEALKCMKVELESGEFPIVLAKSLVLAASHSFTRYSREGVLNAGEIEVVGQLIVDLLSMLEKETLPSRPMPKSIEGAEILPIKVDPHKPTVIEKKEINIDETYPPRTNWKYKTGPVSSMAELQEVFKQLDGVHGSNSDSLISLVRFLPIPDADPANKAFYKDFTPEQAREALKELLQISTKLKVRKERQGELYVAQLHITAFADALMVRIPELKAAGYTLGQIPENAACASIQLGDELTRYEKLIRYFDSKKTSGALFDYLYQTPESMDKYFQANAQDPEDKSKYGIYTYLLQFAPPSLENRAADLIKKILHYSLNKAGSDKTAYDVLNDYIANLEGKANVGHKESDILLGFLTEIDLNSKDLAVIWESFLKFCKEKHPNAYKKIAGIAIQGPEQKKSSRMFGGNSPPQQNKIASFGRLASPLDPAFFILKNIYCSMNHAFTGQGDTLLQDVFFRPSNRPPSSETVSFEVDSLVTSTVTVDYRILTTEEKKPLQGELMQFTFVDAAINENNLNVAQNNDESLPQDEYNDLRRIKQCPRTRIQQLISWVNLHPFSKSGNLFKYIEFLFLEKGNVRTFDRITGWSEGEEIADLGKVCAANPAIRRDFQSMILKRMERTNLQDADEIGFWMRIALWGESRIAEEPNMTIDKAFLEKVKQTVLQKIPPVSGFAFTVLQRDQAACLYIHLAYFELYEKQINKTQVENYFTCLFKAHFLNSNPKRNLNFLFGPVSERTVDDFHIRSKEFEFLANKFLTNKEHQAERNRLGASFAKFIGVDAGQAVWSSHGWPVLKAVINGNTYVVRIDTGTVYKNNQPIKPATLIPEDDDYVRGKGYDTNITFVQEGNTFTAADGSYQVIPKDRLNPPVIRKKFPFYPDGMLEFVNLERIGQKFESQIKEGVNYYLSDYTFWLGGDKMYVVDNEGKLVATYDPAVGFCKNENGKVYVQIKAYNHPIITLFKNTKQTAKTIFWSVDNKIVQIEIPSMNGLKFSAVTDANNKTVFECEQHKGYILAEEQGKIGTLRNPGALCLVHKNDSGKQIIILPPSKLEDRNPLDQIDKETQLKFNPETPIKEKGYFEYEFNPKTELVSTQDPQAALFLSYVHQANGQFILAKFYLDRIPRHELPLEDAKQILDAMGGVKIKSPQAIAFTMHLMLRSLEEGWESGKDNSAMMSLLRKIMQDYHQYSHLKQDGMAEALVITDDDLGKLNALVGGAWRHRPQPLKLDTLAGISKHNSAILLPKLKTAWKEKGTTPPPFKLDKKKTDQLKEYLKANFKGLFLKALEVSSSDVNKKLFIAELEYLAHCITITPESFKHENNYIKILYMAVNNPDPFDSIVSAEMLFDTAVVVSADFQPQTEAPTNIVPVTVPVGAVKQKELTRTSLVASVNPNPGATAPAANILTQAFTVSHKPVFEGRFGNAFALQAGNLTKIAARIYGRMKGAFESTLMSRTRPVYALKENVPIEKLVQDEIASEHEKSQKIAGKIALLTKSDSAKMSPEQRLKYHKFQIERAGKGEREISIPDVLLASGTRDATNLLAMNPFLTPEALAEINKLALEYMLSQSQLTQLKEAQHALRSGPQALQEAAELLARKRKYDPYEWPELLFYEYSTGLMLREDPDQAALLINLFNLLFKANKTEKDRADLRRISFEFQAGGGKTKIISAILASKAISAGKIPIFLSLPALTDVVKKDLREVLLNVFSKTTVRLNINLATAIDAPVMQKAVAMLQSCKAKGECIIMTPESYHAINLAWQRALEEGNSPLIQEIQQFQAILKEDGIFLIDEAHHNVDALMQANMALGEQKPLPERQLKLIHHAYQIMTGNVKVGAIADVLQVKDNKQAQVNEKDREVALNALAKALIDMLPEQGDRDTLMHYITTLDAAPPDFVVQSPDKEMIALVRALRLHILPHVLQKVGEMDYGAALNTQDPVVTPRSQKNPSNSKFENPFIAAALTCQMIYQTGITNPVYFRDEILKLQLQEKQNKTPISDQFYAFQGSENAIALAAITAADLDNPAICAELMKKLGRFPPLVKRYLDDFALQNIMVTPYKFTSTGAQLVAAPWGAVQFSATLGDKELYPYAPDDSSFKSDPEFLANVAQRLCMDQNSAVHFLDPTSPEALLEDLFQRDPAAFNKLEGLIDLGYWSKGSTPRSWAAAFNESARKHKKKSAGSLYFDKDQAGEKFLYFLPSGSNTPVKLRTTNLKIELPKLGIKSEEVFKIYAPDETTGTDLQISPHAKMIVTVGENTTLSDTAQAVMRMRQFLADTIDPEKSQSALFVVSRQLEGLMPASGPPMNRLMNWMMENESKKLKDAILANAKQDINFALRQFVIDKVSSTRESSEFMDTVRFERYSELLRQPTEFDPFNMYAYPSKDQPVRQYLTEYALRVWERIKAWDPKVYHDNTHENSPYLQAIIARAEKSLTVIKTPAIDHNSSAKQETQIQQQQQQQQQQQLQQQQRVHEANAAHPTWLFKYASEKCDLQRIPLLEKSEYLIPATEGRAKFPNVPPHLLFAKNQQLMLLSFPYQKPIQCIMALEENGVRRFIACTGFDAEQWMQQLKEGKVRDSLKVCIFAMDGSTIQSNNPIAQDDEFKDVLLYCNLLNGIILDKDQLKKRIGNNADLYAEAWKNCKNFHIDGLQRFNDLQMNEVLAACRKI